MSVTRLSMILEDGDVKVAAGTDDVEVSRDIKLPQFVLAFDQLLIELTFQSWNDLDEAIRKLQAELILIEPGVNHRAARELDDGEGDYDIVQLYCPHPHCEQNREVVRTWEEPGHVCVELACRHQRRLAMVPR